LAGTGRERSEEAGSIQENAPRSARSSGVRETLMARGGGAGRGAGASAAAAGAASNVEAGAAAALMATAAGATGDAGAVGRGRAISSGSSGASEIFGGVAKGFSTRELTDAGCGRSPALSQRKRARFSRSSTMPKREGHSSP
jgi:hypothetical protein